MDFLKNLFKPKSQPEDDAERSALIMERLKARRGQETGKWLSLMQDANRTPPPEGPPPTLEDVDKWETLDDAPYVPPLEARYSDVEDQGNAASEDNQTVAGVNKLFAEFKRQASEYNASATGTQMTLTVHPPVFSFEAPRYDKTDSAPRKISVFKGHINAQHWAMLVQGYEDKIDVYVISASEIPHFTLNDIRESQVSPFMTINSSQENGRRVWNVGGETIATETLPLLTKELLGDLIRVAAGTMSEAELFGDHKTALKLGETVAQGYTS